MRVAIVGAGLSGAFLSVLLGRAGHTVRVFDKGRGPGGRLATRRHESGVRFDHGAPGVPMPDGDPFSVVLEALVEKGHAARWSGLGEPMAVGQPGMSQIVRALLEPFTVATGATVTRAERSADGWRLSLDDETVPEPFDALVLTVPAPQLPPIIGAVAPELAAAAQEASYRPQWTFMAGFPARATAVLSGLAPSALSDHGVEVAIHDGGKPGRNGAATLVCHMDAAWSEANLERDKGDVAQELGTRFSSILGLDAPEIAMAHRWRYARVLNAAEPDIYDRDLALGVAGDWTVGPTARDAFVSAVRCAEAIGTR